jgi:hypothetical protein
LISWRDTVGTRRNGLSDSVRRSSIVGSASCSWASNNRNKGLRTTRAWDRGIRPWNGDAVVARIEEEEEEEKVEEEPSGG